MALTLAEAKVGMADKVDQHVIDEFRRASLLLDMLTFPWNRWLYAYLWIYEIKNTVYSSCAFHQY